MKNIIVSTPNWLGDIVFSTPVYRALKESFPDVRITALAVPRVKEVLKLCPFIDEVIEYDEDGEDRPLLAKAVLIQRIHHGRFDAGYLLRPSISRTMIMALAGVPRRVGFSSRKSSFLLTRCVDPNGNDDIHRTDVYLRLLENDGIKIHERRTSLVLSDDSKSRAMSFLEARGLKANEVYAVLNSGGNWDLKQWPWESFAELARRVTKELGGIRVVLPGSAMDVERTEMIAKRSGVFPVVIAGGTTLNELASVMASARFVVSADTGPLHLASAVGAITVGIFGPTRSEITGPRGMGRALVVQKDVGCNLAPCYFLECPDNRCMKLVTVEDVLSAIKQIM